MGQALVMVVDSDALLRRSYARMARHRGVRFAAAASGEEALALISPADPPVLVISAQRLPGMKGVALLQHLLGTHPRVLAVLSSGNPPLDPQGIRVLPKPVDVETFSALVDEALSARP